MESVEMNKAIDVLAERILKSGVQPVTCKFQPVFDCFSAQVVAYLGNVYVSGSSLGVLSPDDYIPVVAKAEKGLELLTVALEDFSLEASSLSPDLYRVEFFSFPASNDLLKSDKIYYSLSAIIANYPFLKGKICLCFSGDILNEDEALLSKAFSDIRSAGIKVGIKNFGDKFMPVSLLGIVPPDYLFLNEEETIKSEDKKLFAPVGALIKYASNLGIKTIALRAKSDKGIRELSLVECFGTTVCPSYSGLRYFAEPSTLTSVMSVKEVDEQ